MRRKSVLMSADPSTVGTGISVFTEDGVDVDMCKLQIDNTPHGVLATMKSVKEKYEDCEISFAEEEWSLDVVTGLHSLKGVRSLERVGERWACIATLMKFKVYRVLNQTWHSHFGFKKAMRNDPKTSKFQSVDLVIKLFPELVSSRLIINGDIADSLLIGKYVDDKFGIVS